MTEKILIGTEGKGNWKSYRFKLKGCGEQTYTCDEEDWKLYEIKWKLFKAGVSEDDINEFEECAMDVARRDEREGRDENW